MAGEWRFTLTATSVTLVALPIVGSPFNIRSVEQDPRTAQIIREWLEPFLPEGHEHSKSGPPPKTVVTVVTSSAVIMAYSLPEGVTIEEFEGRYTVRVPWGWLPKA